MTHKRDCAYWRGNERCGCGYWLKLKEERDAEIPSRCEV